MLKMRAKTFTNWIMIILMMMSVISCEKHEGFGGTAKISGKIMNQYYNDDYSVLVRESTAVDEEVFLLFGEEESVGERVETSATGNFEFKFLYPGAYTVYYMSEDSATTLQEEYPRMVTVELSAGEELDLGMFHRLQTLDFDDGTATISGTIRLINYKNESEFPFLVVKDTSYAQEYEVYLTYGENAFYDERIRTGYDGYFEFGSLIPGDYKIFTYSEDISGGTGAIPIIKEVSIENEDEHIDLGTIFVEQL